MKFLRSARFVIVVGTAASYAAAWLLFWPPIVPLLNVAPAFPFLVQSWRRGNRAEALTRMLAWALVLAVCATITSYLDPERAGALYLNGDAYRREMFGWISSGVGRETDPTRFIPQHALHAVLFVVLSLATGSVLSMPMGAALMNYMGCYVGSLASTAGTPAVIALAAWSPWSLVRIASFVTFGVVLAGPLWSRCLGFRFRLAEHRDLLALAAAGLLLDLLMKALLAPRWPPILQHLLR